MLSHRSSNLLAALSIALADAQVRACEALGVIASDAAALITVGYHPGVTVGRLAPTIGFTQSAAVRSVERLLAAGLVERQRGDDKRQVRISLTPKGVALRSKILTARRAAVERAAAPLRPHQQTELTKMAELMLAALTDDRQSADHICRLCDENVCPPATCPVECAAVCREGP